MCNSRDEGRATASDQITLVFPSLEHKEMYIDFVEDYQKANEMLNPRILRSGLLCYEDFVDKMEQYSSNRGLPECEVPQTLYWLMKDHRILGAILIRHEVNEPIKRVNGHISYSIRPSERRRGYGTLMLALALSKCRQLKLDRVWITCSVNNIAAQKVVLNNGGVLDFENDLFKPLLLGYSIDLPSSY